MCALTVKKITPHIFTDMGRVEEIRKRGISYKTVFYKSRLLALLFRDIYFQPQRCFK